MRQDKSGSNATLGWLLLRTVAVTGLDGDRLRQRESGRDAGKPIQRRDRPGGAQAVEFALRCRAADRTSGARSVGRRIVAVAF